MRKNSPVGVVLRGRTKQQIQVLALESKRSVSWVISDFIDTILAQPELQKRVQSAVRAVLLKDPTFGPALLLNGQRVQPLTESAAAQPATARQAKVLQPVFSPEDLSPSNDLAIRAFSRTRAAQDGTTSVSVPSPAEVQPDLGDARPARGLLGGKL